MKNGYLVGTETDRKAVYIDPGDESVQIIGLIKERGFSLEAILLTHGHMDHICGVGSVKEKWDVPIYLHQADQFIYDGLQEQSRFFGMNYSPAPPVDRYLEDMQSLRFGSLELKVYHTPGHSPGGVCLEIGENVFSGDLIFAGSVGRSDLPGGDMDTLMRSIREMMEALPETSILWPGHGPKTSVGRELKTNPFRNSFLP